MAYQHLGEMIVYWRKQRGLTQEDLADGIMSVTALSKIESGDSIPYWYNMKKILDRLGISHSSVAGFYMTNKGVKYKKATDELDGYLSRGNTEDAARIIKKLKADAAFTGDSFYNQHLIAAEAAIAIIKKGEPEKIIVLLQNAIAMVRRTFDENSIEEHLLTTVDFKILNMLATQYYDTGRVEESIAVLFGLKHNIEKRCIDKAVKGERYPQTIYHLTKLLSQTGRNKEAIEICDQGTAVCLETGNYRYLPLISMNKVTSLYKLGDKDAAWQLLRDVYYTLSMHKEFVDKEAVKKYAEDNFPGMVL
ncbi:MAG: helix-turn-helix transcriptional regulator [Firmicutes bacterium]|nr:helix-turn-helix transcriptional regulator [Bacillota bacterium]